MRLVQGIMLGASVAALAITAVAGFHTLDTTSSVDIHGRVVVQDMSNVGTNCQFDQMNGYHNVRPGQTVLIYGPSNFPVASTTLGKPKVIKRSAVCEFPFTITGPIYTQPRYEVAVVGLRSVWFSPKGVSHATIGVGSAAHN
jgi:hypothetical protein